MKKMLCVAVITLFFTNIYGQVSLGSFTRFPDSKLFGIAYKPELAIGKLNDQYVISLSYTSPKTYASFDEKSILLMRLDNDSVIRLPLAKELDVSEKYDNINTQYGICHLYITYTYYYINDETLDVLVKSDATIKKIRVSFTNGDVEDWEIKDNYRAKLKKGLLKSFQQVESQDAIRKEKIDDVESGF